jgi:cbb3-type cytochrome oxidase subunit 3
MAVVPLTLAISLCLVFSFIVFFLREHARGRLSSAERDSLLPLAEETTRPATRHQDR